MNVTSKQWFQIVSSVIGGLITGAALLQTLFGQDLTIKIVAVLGIANIIMGSVGASLSGQANLVKDVQAMPGVERIRINENANPALAALAVDPANTKILPTPEAQAAITATAAGKNP